MGMYIVYCIYSSTVVVPVGDSTQLSDDGRSVLFLLFLFLTMNSFFFFSFFFSFFLSLLFLPCPALPLYFRTTLNFFLTPAPLSRVGGSTRPDRSITCLLLLSYGSPPKLLSCCSSKQNPLRLLSSRCHHHDTMHDITPHTTWYRLCYTTTRTYISTLHYTTTLHCSTAGSGSGSEVPY